MRPKAVFAILGALTSVALAAGLVGTGFAQADAEDGEGVRAGDVTVEDGVVRAGDVVIDESGVRIEGGPSIDSGEESRTGDGESGSVEEEGSSDEGDVEDEESTPVGDGEVLLKLKGDEGVEFSGTCSVGGEEQEIQGQVPEEFTFALDGDELECEVRKEGDGTLKLVLLSGDDRISQRVSGDGTLKFSYSGNGVSSSTSSVSGSSSAVNQSSVVQSSSSSTSR